MPHGVDLLYFTYLLKEQNYEKYDHTQQTSFIIAYDHDHDDRL